MDDRVAARGVSWDTPGNAARYAEYTEKHPLYELTSRALVDALALRPDEVVLDLCCGTGATTQAILAAEASLRVIALDFSESQLAIARAKVADARVTFVQGRAEEADRLTPTPCHAIVCNAGFWQLAPQAIPAAHATLVADGRLAFNLPAAFARSAVTRLAADDQHLADAARRPPGSLERAMLDEARARFGYDPAAASSSSSSSKTFGFQEARFFEALSERGFRLARSFLQAIPISPEAAFDWYLIPVFRSNVLPRMAPEDSERVLRAAYARWRVTARETPAVWIHFVATKATGN